MLSILSSLNDNYDQLPVKSNVVSEEMVRFRPFSPLSAYAGYECNFACAVVCIRHVIKKILSRILNLRECQLLVPPYKL